MCNILSKKRNNAFTLIEFIIVIVIIVILSRGGAWLMAYLMQNSVFVPKQLNMEMLVSDALDIMVEGDSTARGLRYSRAITNAQPNYLSFLNQGGQTVVYWLNASDQLVRSVNGSPALGNPIPYYQGAGIQVLGNGVSRTIFRYYSADPESEIVSGVGTNVRRINITVSARTGTGSFSQWEGWSQQSTSVAVKRYQ